MWSSTRSRPFGNSRPSLPTDPTVMSRKMTTEPGEMPVPEAGTSAYTTS